MMYKLELKVHVISVAIIALALMYLLYQDEVNALVNAWVLPLFDKTAMSYLCSRGHKFKDEELNVQEK